jgi:hypothetical protein
LTQSNTATDLESIVVNITHGKSYYFVVNNPSGGTGGPYSLQTFVPVAQRPVARDDSATTALSSDVTINVLANDRDPDGELAAVAITLTTPNHGTAIVTTDNRIRYSAPANFTGVDLFTYTLTDGQKLTSAPATVQVMVLDLDRQRPFLSPSMAADVNNDGTVSPIDALLVINEINLHGSRNLPTTPVTAQDVFGFVDINGNGSVEPLDALLVISVLNSGATKGSEGEGESNRLDWFFLNTNLDLCSIRKKTARPAVA